MQSYAFPENALVGSIGDLARTLAAGTEVPEEFYFAAGLTLMGAKIGTKLKLDIGFDVEPRLYTILLGESYSVKKSTAMKRTIQFFNGINPAAPIDVVYGVGSAEGLARELVSKPQAVLAYDELQALVGKCQVKGSTLLPAVTSLFEGTHWSNATKSAKASITVNDAHLSLLACCTLDTYADIWKQDAIAIGLPNRLFIVNGDRRDKVAWPAKPDATKLAEIQGRIRIQLERLPQELKISDEAKGEWERWYVNLPNSEHARRLETIGFRLLALIALTTDKTTVDLETVKTVASILDYELDLRIQTDPIDADSTVAKLEQKIRRCLQKGPASDRKLRQAVHADRAGLWAYEKARNNLRNVSGEIDCKDGQYYLVEETSKQRAA
jgi:hypothetical protein